MPGPTDNLRGVTLMCVSMAAFTLNDTALKSVSDELPLFQAIFLRGSFSLIAIFGLALVLGGVQLRMPRREAGLILLRAMGEVLGAYFFLTALYHMPLANVSAILQALPLTVTLAGAIFLGEAVGWRRLTAILVGFIGVLLIVKPGGEGFSVYSVYALASVAAVTFRDLVTRQMAPETSSLTAAVVTAVMVTLCFGVASTTTVWAPLTLLVTAKLAASAGLVLIGYLASIGAMRHGDIAVVSPYRYTGLIWAILLGVAIFGDWPDATTLMGAALVVATGIYTFYRERRVARAAVRAHGQALEQRAAVDTATDSH